MIEIKMTGMCEGCEYADLYLREKGYLDEAKIACRHYSACRRIYDEMIDMLNEEQDNGQSRAPEGGET